MGGKLTSCFHPWVLFIYFFQFLFIYDSHRERERGRDTGRGRSRLHEPGARRGIRSRVSRIAPWAKGRHQTAAPPRDPRASVFHLEISYLDVPVLLYHLLLSLLRMPVSVLVGNSLQVLAAADIALGTADTLGGSMSLPF